MRRWNSHAPVFRARIRPDAWVEHRTGRRVSRGGAAVRARRRVLRPGQSAVVPCGPWSDWESSRWTGWSSKITIATARMNWSGSPSSCALEGATALVTTEKDAVNLCDDVRRPAGAAAALLAEDRDGDRAGGGVPRRVDAPDLSGAGSSRLAYASNQSRALEARVPAPHGTRN